MDPHIPRAPITAGVPADRLEQLLQPLRDRSASASQELGALHEATNVAQEMLKVRMGSHGVCWAIEYRLLPVP